jgi:Myb-like DNA-binding domain
MLGVRATHLGRRGSGMRRKTSNFDSKCVAVSLASTIESLQHRAVQAHGSDWVTVADLIGRSSADCSDRYRQHVQYKDTKRRGTSPTPCCLSLRLHLYKGLGHRRRKANFFVQLKSWLAQVQPTRLPEDFGFPCQRL